MLGKYLEALQFSLNALSLSTKFFGEIHDQTALAHNTAAQIYEFLEEY